MKKILLLAVLAFAVGGTTAFVVHHPGNTAACGGQNC
jgi:hypothetical protein